MQRSTAMWEIVSSGGLGLPVSFGRGEGEEKDLKDNHIQN